MAYIRTIPFEHATGTVKEIYDQDVARNGYLSNDVQALSLRPDVFLAWRTLIGAIRSHMDLRRYELVTVVAAARLRCSY